jgi:hypothetical protein
MPNSEQNSIPIIRKVTGAPYFIRPSEVAELAVTYDFGELNRVAWRKSGSSSLPGTNP